MAGNESDATAFLDACGATGPLEVEVEDPRGGKAVRLLLAQPFLVVGRDERADLPLEDGDVSRRHAYLQVLGGRVFAFDLASRTGLSRDGGPAGSGWLGRGQALRVGPFKVRVVGGVPDLPPRAGGDPLAACPPGRDPLPPVTLESAGQDVRRVVWPMDRALALVGQSPRCKLRVAGEAVSRFSCGVVRTPAGAWVVDLLGRPGVVVNEAPVRWAPLRDGDQFRVGPVSFRVHSGPPLPGAPAATPSLPVPVERPASRGGALLPRLPAGLLAPDPRVPAPADWAAENEPLASLLRPLAGQFASMQQQMFEQFTQMMMAMGRMFSDLQRDQLGLVREELARLQQLSQELRELQAELASRQAEAGRPGPAAPPQEVLPPSCLGPVGDAGPAPGVANGARAGPPGAPSREEETSAATAGPDFAGGAARRPRQPGGAAGPSDEDIHARLYQRIQQLQQEREGRWQKLFSSLFGKRPGNDPPG
jgi:pSer/pThr/pTyr-binding forkhead associated (FHA) protein